MLHYATFFVLGFIIGALLVITKENYKKLKELERVKQPIRNNNNRFIHEKINRRSIEKPLQQPFDNQYIDKKSKLYVPIKPKSGIEIPEQE